MCRHISIWGFQNRVCPSVCTPRKVVRSYHSFVNISPTLVIDTSMERSSRVLHHQKFYFFLKSSKFEFWLVPKIWNHLSFVNISPTLVIDTSMERSSRVLHHQKFYFFKKSSKFEFWLVPKIWNHLSFVNISPTLGILQSYINGKVFTSTTPWKPQNLNSFQKSSKFGFWLVLMNWNHSSRSQHAPICRHRGCIVVPLRVDI